MKRILLIVAFIFGLAFALWCLRKSIAETALAWGISQFSSTEITFELNSFNPPRIEFNSFALPEWGVLIKHPAVYIQSPLSPARAIEMEAEAIEIGLKGDNSQSKEDSGFSDLLSFLDKLKNLPSGTITVLKTPFRFTTGNAGPSLSDGTFTASIKNRELVSLEAEGKDISGQWSATQISNASFSIKGSTADVSKLSAIVSADSVSQPVPMQKVLIDGSIQGTKGRLGFDIKKLKASLLGGKISRSPNIEAKTYPGCSVIPLKAEGIEIPQVLSMYPENRVSATGSLEGDIPLLYCSTGWRIENASLSGTGGNIKLTTPIDAAHEDLSFAFRALQDFDYSKLNATLSMQSNGDMRIALTIEGISRSLNKGTPLVVNLNVEENLWALFKSLGIVRKLTDQLDGGHGIR